MIVMGLEVSSVNYAKTNTADVDSTATLGDGTKVWHLAQICDGVTLGGNCIVGRGAYIGRRRAAKMLSVSQFADDTVVDVGE